MSATGPAPSSQAGYSLIEMIVTMAILSVILGGLTTIFVQGNSAETDISYRFQSQQQAQTAISNMRSDGHRACNAVLTGSSSVVFYYYDSSTSLCYSSDSSWSNSNCANYTFPNSACITWCTRASGTQYKLYRLFDTATCGTTGGEQQANYLTTGNIFTYTAGATTGTDAHDLSLLYLDVPVTSRAAKKYDKYEITDVIVLRNSLRG